MTGDRAPTVTDVLTASVTAGASIAHPVSPFPHIDMLRVVLPTPRTADRMAASLGAYPSGDALWRYDSDAALYVAVWR